MSSYNKSYSLNVDTSPMAREIEQVSSNVSDVKTAVVAMQTAVIGAEVAATDHVCKNINRGFFTLIHSQISQKIAARKSEVNSIIMELQTQGKILSSIKKRMEADYHMIAKRYTELFQSLNKALYMHIYELDRPVLHFVEKDLHLLENRINRLTALVPVNQLESLSLSQLLAASYTKQNGLKALRAMQGFMGELKQQKNKSERILLNKSIRKEHLQYVPVLLTIQSHDIMSSEISKVYFPETDDPAMNNQMGRSIRNDVYDKMDDLKWKTVSKENKEKVSLYFHRFLAECELPEKVRKNMIELYNANLWEELKG